MTALHRHHQPWSLEEEITLVGRRRERARAKVIARELGRTPEAIGRKVAEMKAKGRLAQHRAEELALLERVLAESRQRDGGER